MASRKTAQPVTPEDRVSLHPVPFEEALEALLSIPPSKGRNKDEGEKDDYKDGEGDDA